MNNNVGCFEGTGFWTTWTFGWMSGCVDWGKDWGCFFVIVGCGYCWDICGLICVCCGVGRGRGRGRGRVNGNWRGYDGGFSLVVWTWGCTVFWNCEGVRESAGSWRERGDALGGSCRGRGDALGGVRDWDLGGSCRGSGDTLGGSCRESGDDLGASESFGRHICGSFSGTTS